MSDKNLTNESGSPFVNLDLFDANNGLIIEQLEKVSNGLSELKSVSNPTLSEVPFLSPLSKSLMVTELQMAVIALVALSNPDCEAVTEKFLVKSLMPFTQNRRAPIQQAVQSLITEKIIYRDLENDIELQLGQRFRAALHAGDLEAIRSLKPFGLIPFLRNFMELVMAERHYSPFGSHFFTI